MSNKMTVSVPDELLARLKRRYPEINWASVVRAAILRKLTNLEELTKRGAL